MKRVTASLILLLVAAPVAAQEPVQEKEHVVREGDTLWDLAGYYFSDPFRWPRIYEANETVVEDPHWIYPQEVLVIPGLQGDVARAPREVARVAARPADRPARTVFYRPPPQPADGQGGEPTVLSEPVRERMPVRPGEFTSAPFVTHPDDLEVVGGFIRTLRENRDVGGAPSAHPQEAIFLRYAEDVRPAVDQRVMLVHVGDRIAGTSPGLRAVYPTAIVRITTLEEDVMQGRIETQYGPVHRGDVAIPLPMYPDFTVESAQPVADGYDLEGEILYFEGEPPLPGRADIAFVNLGSRDGVSVGDLFTAYLPERSSERNLFRAYVEQLPAVNVAVLRVVRVTDEVATVIVEKVLLPRLETGLQVRRTHRIP